ncbi:MAG: type II toxin-antitoxin system PemK/MazF family toxin [Saprospirales bacterium]|nr:type II toxin-antitoxin system PemK/MazF family toxin [Saprospirales bacterium]
MKRGEIWQVNLDPTIGTEIQKSRPAVIINDDAMGILPLKIIVPITDWKLRYGAAPWMVKLEPDTTNNLSKTSAADCFQVRSVSQIRLLRKIGDTSAATMTEIGQSLKAVLRL